MWKSTWTYTKEVYNMDEELAQRAEAEIQSEFEIEMTETLGKPQKDLGFDLVDDTVELQELDPFAEGPAFALNAIKKNFDLLMGFWTGK